MRKLLFTSIMLLCSVALLAQKGDVLEGSWKSLKDASKFDLEFDYSNVQIPDFDTEEEYIKQKMKDKEADEPGTGEAWKKRWFDDREAHFEPKFVESFNKRGDEKVSKKYDNAPYIMKITTTRQYNGWNVGVMRKAARIDATISVYKRGETKSLLSVAYEDVKGGDAMGYDFASHSRVAEGYAKLAKSFAKELKKKAK
ncbi:hypothetical protein [Rasiella sp. SM2506]|uniref:hypothetical protein n=1 Tax=Rasiella sp. SM2506 TaxID=3423914 RepID=UPI003D799E91